MKNLLCTLFATLLLGGFNASAQLYPMLSTTSNRTVDGGLTNLAVLNSNLVFTGTMRATGAATLTNSGNVFAGDGSGLTGVGGGVATLNGSATNLTVRSSGGNALTVNTNALVVDTNNVFVGGTLTATNANFYGQTNLGTMRFSAHNTYDIGPASAMPRNISAGTLVSAPAGDFNSYVNSSRVILSTGGTRIWGVSDGVLKLTDSGEVALGSLQLQTVWATNLYATNLTVGAGAAVTGILSATATLDFDLTALTVEDLTITVTGAADGNIVTLGVPNASVTTTIQFTAWVSAADTVTVRARTEIVGEDPASGTFRATVIKH